MAKNVMRWDPKTGESKVYADSADAPVGHLDYHPDNAPKQDKQEKAALSLTRKEIRAELDAGGVTYDKAASTDVLYNALLNALKVHLDEAEVVYPADADAKALLALVPEPK